MAEPADQSPYEADGTTERRERVGGTVIRGADGSVYFLRDEVLKACRVEEEESVAFLNELLDADANDPAEGAEKQTFRVSSGDVVQGRSFVGPFGGAYDRRRLVAYTSMCTGTMGLIEFTPRPFLDEV